MNGRISLAKSWRPILCALLLCVIQTGVKAAPSASASLSLLSDDGEIGWSAEMVAELLRRADIPYELQVLPWLRAYRMAQSQPQTCLYSTSRTAERESSFVWIGPLREAVWVLWTRADQTAPASLAALRGRHVGARRGDAIASYVQAQGIETDLANSDLQSATMLLHGRIDYWAASRRAGERVAQQPGFENRLKAGLEFGRVGLYLACNPALPAPWSQRMQQAVSAMEADGYTARLQLKYASRH